MSDPFSTDLNLSEHSVDKLIAENNALRARAEAAERERDALIAKSHRDGASRRRQEKEYEAQRDELVSALERIKVNAQSWHGVPEESSGHVKRIVHPGRDDAQRLAKVQPHSTSGAGCNVCEFGLVPGRCSNCGADWPPHGTSEALGVPRNVDDDAYDSYDQPLIDQLVEALDKIERSSAHGSFIQRTSRDALAKVRET